MYPGCHWNTPPPFCGLFTTANTYSCRKKGLRWKNFLLFIFILFAPKGALYAIVSVYCFLLQLSINHSSTCIKTDNQTSYFRWRVWGLTLGRSPLVPSAGKDSRHWQLLPGESFSLSRWKCEKLRLVKQKYEKLRLVKLPIFLKQFPCSL